MEKIVPPSTVVIRHVSVAEKVVNIDFMKPDSAPVLPDTADVHSAQPSPAVSDSESDASDCGAVGLEFDGGVPLYGLRAPASRRRPLGYCS